MTASVPRQKCHGVPADFRDRDDVRRRSVRCVDLHLNASGEELLEPTTAKHANAGPWRQTSPPGVQIFGRGASAGAAGGGGGAAAFGFALGGAGVAPSLTPSAASIASE